MAIEAKELMLGIEFEAFGLFAGVTDFTPDGGERIMSYRFDYFGGQFPVAVTLEELENAPEEGTPFYLKGKVRYNNKTGTITLVASEKKQLPELSPEQYVKGIKMVGAGSVVEKKLSTMNRKSFYKTTLRWQGGLHLFSIDENIFARVPQPGQYCKFEIGISTYTERADGGRQIQHQVPVLLAIRGEELAGSTPSRAANPEAAAPRTKPA